MVSKIIPREDPVRSAVTSSVTCIVWQGEFVGVEKNGEDGGLLDQGLRVFNFIANSGAENHKMEDLKVGLAYTWEITGKGRRCQRKEGRTMQTDSRDVMAMADEWDVPDEDGISDDTILNTISHVGNKVRVRSVDFAPGTEETTTTAATATATATGAKTGKKTQERHLVLPLLRGAVGEFRGCSWFYVVDLDKDVLEIYSGWEMAHDKNHRFWKVRTSQGHVPAYRDSWKFDEILTAERALLQHWRISALCEKVGGGVGSGLRQLDAVRMTPASTMESHPVVGGQWGAKKTL